MCRATEGVAPCADPISFTRTPVVHHGIPRRVHPSSATLGGFCSAKFFRGILYQMPGQNVSLWRGERFLMSFDAS